MSHALSPFPFLPCQLGFPRPPTYVPWNALRVLSSVLAMEATQFYFFYEPVLKRPEIGRYSPRPVSRTIAERFQRVVLRGNSRFAANSKWKKTKTTRIESWAGERGTLLSKSRLERDQKVMSACRKTHIDHFPISLILTERDKRKINPDDRGACGPSFHAPTINVLW